VFTLHFFRALVTSLRALSQSKARFWLFYLLIGVQIFILLSTRIRKVLLKCSVFQFLPNSRHSAYTANYTKAIPKPDRTINLGKVIVKISKSMPIFCLHLEMCHSKSSYVLISFLEICINSR